MDPDWLGSPHHFLVAFGLAIGIAVMVCRLWDPRWWIAACVGAGVASSAEIAFELVEYALTYHESAAVTAYQDTLADLANSLAGGIAGGVAGGRIGMRKTSQ